MLLPNGHRFTNFIRFLSRAHFPNELTIPRQKRHQPGQIHVPRKWRLMVLGRPDAILDMTSEGARPNPLQPFRVVEKSEVRLDLDMTEIVPYPTFGELNSSSKSGISRSDGISS